VRREMDKKISDKVIAEKNTKKTTTKSMIDNIKVRLDAGEVLTLGALSQEFGRDINELIEKINVYLDTKYAYGMEGLTLHKATPEKEKVITPTKEQLVKVSKIYAYLAEEAAKRYTVKDNESRYYEIYCNPVKDDLVKHLNFMNNIYTKSSQSLAYEAEKWDQLAQIVQENDDEATTEDRNPMVTEIIDHLQHMAKICRARSFKILDTAENERMEGGDLVCLKK
jgi:hypothetical protein